MLRSLPVGTAPAFDMTLNTLQKHHELALIFRDQYQLDGAMVSDTNHKQKRRAACKWFSTHRNNKELDLTAIYGEYKVHGPYRPSREGENQCICSKTDLRQIYIAQHSGGTLLFVGSECVKYLEGKRDSVSDEECGQLEFITNDFHVEYEADEEAEDEDYDSEDDEELEEENEDEEENYDSEDDEDEEEYEEEDEEYEEEEEEIEEEEQVEEMDTTPDEEKKRRKVRQLQSVGYVTTSESEVEGARPQKRSRSGDVTRCSDCRGHFPSFIMLGTRCQNCYMIQKIETKNCFE